MSVMENIRRSTDSTAMKLVFGAIVIVFIFWGIGGAGAQVQLIAEVNGERITDTQFNKVMRRASRAQGAMDDSAQRELARAVIDSLIAQELMVQQAREAGLEVSDDEVAAALYQNPMFLDDDGVFSIRLYEEGLKSLGYTRGRFEEQVRTDLLLRKVQTIAGSGIRVSEAEVRQAFDAQATRVKVRWMMFSEDGLLRHVPVDDAAIQAQLGADEPGIKERFEAEKATRWTRPARAELSMILLRGDLPEGQGKVEDAVLKARADAVLAEAQGGADFAELARTWSEDASAVNGGKLGAMTKGQLDPALAEAVFSAEPGGLTPVVQTARGYAIAKVASRKEAVETPYDEAKTTIAREMVARQGVGDYLSSLSQQVLDAWKTGGSPPAELMEANGLSVVEAGPFSPANPRLVGAGSSPALQVALMDVTGPGLLEQVFETSTGRVLVEVTDFTPPDDALFADIKDNLEIQILRERQQAFMEQWEQDLRSRARIVQHYQP
jgi:peptidyl-prolyl cis-trans isomerase D